MKLKRLVVFVVMTLLAACGGAESESAPVAVVDGDDVTAYQIVIAADDFAVGTPRIPFIIYDGSDTAAGIESIQIAAFDLSGDEPVAGWRGAAVDYSDYAVPYWIVEPDLPTAGVWGLGAIVTREDGSTVEVEFAVQILEANAGPAIGDLPPASVNRTTATEPDLSLLTSDPAPDERLYEMTVADAYANGKPTVVMFATPAFCQTAICTPVVESIKSIYDEYSADVNFIHLEIYKTFNPELVVADEVGEWELSSEPWTFVLTGDNEVAFRFGGPVSPTELADALDEVVP